MVVNIILLSEDERIVTFDISDEKSEVPVNIFFDIRPVQLLSWLVSLGSREGDVVLDPFMGSWSILLASAINQRKYVGIRKRGCNIKIIKEQFNWYNHLFSKLDVLETYRSVLE
jgi:DNA modification methylase